MGWVWLAVDSGRSLDPYAGVEMSLNDGTPIAQRFVATAWELGARLYEASDACMPVEPHPSVTSLMQATAHQAR